VKTHEETTTVIKLKT